MPTALITHRDCVLHEISPGHPECPERIDAILDQLKKVGVYDFLTHMDAPIASREHLRLAHPENYIDNLYQLAPASGRVSLDADTAMNEHTLNAALRAAGGAVAAVDSVMTGDVSNAFCLVRPPGHHAEKNRAMGFCFFGNVVIAARHALEHYDLNRVAIVDFDVHHGNGTEDIVDGDGRILFCSSFQHPFYPGGFRENVTGQRVNVPLRAGTTSADFRAKITEHWLPALNDFAPELLVISAGFDAHLEDPLAEVCLLDNDFGWITEKLMDIAIEHASGRIVSMLEGGYSLPALARSATLHIKTLAKL
ncbi:MAG: histone deacetylase family protein [Gammaproteobacteria bacterium]|nr:histone deacetylase family protein [Gammaproteobacteria bacterium]